ncbi:hypothetical protein AGMMS49942_19340 [Spirochaetia bacterium]|nr:hypothetical protein AGMMS49942_19340 [Spirochaetia bacterium]
MNEDKILELQRLFARQETELLQSLTTIRNEMAILNGEKQLFRLYINNYTKNPTYYAHLFDDNGKQTDARMSCHTIDKEEAELYALEHREQFLKEYIAKKNKTDFYQLLTNYYTDNNELFLKALKKRSIRPQQIKQYKGFIDNYYIPFLKKNNITTLEKSNHIEVIDLLQSYCRDKNLNGLNSLTTKTLKGRISCSIAPIYNQILQEKSVFNQNNIYEKEKPGERKSLGIIELKTTFSVLFNRSFWQKIDSNSAGDNKIPWLMNKVRNVDYFRLLCMLGNLCGLRNAEIYLLRVSNVRKIGDIYFLNIENSRIDGTGTKTQAGERLIPLHPIVYKHLMDYIYFNKRTDYIFYNGSKNISNSQFLRARNIFCFLCGYDSNTIKEKNIVFYSFRHFFKTMLQNAGIQKDYVEYLMGHTNKSDMSKNYLHLGNVGNTYIEENGKKVIEVIEKYNKDIDDIKIIKKMISYKDTSRPNEKKYYIYSVEKPEEIKETFIVPDFSKNNTDLSKPFPI